MAKKSRNVTLSVHRAVIDDSFPWTLSSLLSELKSGMNAGDHVLKRALLYHTAVKFPQFPKTNEALAAQIALYEQGAEKSTIRPDTYSTNRLTAGENLEFLEHEVAILVDGNYMIACGLGKRQSLLIDAIAQLASRRGIEMHPTTLSFVTTPNQLTIERIRSIGVKSIVFDAANFLGSLDMPTKSLIGSLFGKSASMNDFVKQEMVAELSIHPKRVGRTKLDVIATPKSEWLENAAVKTFKDEDVDSYTIILDDDTKWKEGDLVLNRQVKIGADGSTFSMPEALHAMLTYMDELREKGLLK